MGGCIEGGVVREGVGGLEAVNKKCEARERITWAKEQNTRKFRFLGLN